MADRQIWEGEGFIHEEGEEEYWVGDGFFNEDQPDVGGGPTPTLPRGSLALLGVGI